MEVQPNGWEFLSGWITILISTVLAALSGVATGAYFVGMTKERIENLEKMMQESIKDRADLRVTMENNMRQAVHDIRDWTQKLIADASMNSKRTEAHLDRMEQRVETRLAQLIDLIVGRQPPQKF